MKKENREQRTQNRNQTTNYRPTPNSFAALPVASYLKPPEYCSTQFPKPKGRFPAGKQGMELVKAQKVPQIQILPKANCL
jgi:hypothetical protein